MAENDNKSVQKEDLHDANPLNCFKLFEVLH